MALTLKRSSLVAQVADAIRAEIFANTWQEWIPSERELSATLHVSRNTCRNALQILRNEMLVESVLGLGIRINQMAIRKERSTSQALHSVGLVIPEAMSRLRPQNSLLIDELRQELFDLGVRLDLHNSPIYYHSNPGSALEKLVEKSHHDCWILLLSCESLQRWFMERGIPCIISGSTYAGIKLPCVDQDYRATCRHATGRLIALGHRRVAFFNRRSRAAGDLESEAGFFEAVRASSYAKVKAQTVYHDDSRENIVQLIRQLFTGPSPPTGLLVANSYCYLSVACALARFGFNVPRDVSLISRDDDPFLAYADPEPTRYVLSPGGLVRKYMFLLRPILEGGIVKPNPVRVVPRFIVGASCQAV